MRPFPRVLLASGGIDSLVAYYYLGKPQTVYFDIGGRYSNKEKQVVQSFFPDIIIDNSLHLGDVEQASAYVPYRNLLLATMAATRYSDIVYLAGVKDDVVSDKNEKIFGDFSTLLTKLEGRPIQVLSPFWNMTKAEVVQWFLTHVDQAEELLKQTVSCYSQEDTHYCGRCASCFRKWAALWVGGIKLPFHDQEIMLDYQQRCLSGRYDPLRNKETLKAINEYQKAGGH